MNTTYEKPEVGAVYFRKEFKRTKHLDQYQDSFIGASNGISAFGDYFKVAWVEDRGDYWYFGTLPVPLLTKRWFSFGAEKLYKPGVPRHPFENIELRRIDDTERQAWLST